DVTGFETMTGAGMRTLADLTRDDAIYGGSAVDYSASTPEIPQGISLDIIQYSHLQPFQTEGSFGISKLVTSGDVTQFITNRFSSLNAPKIYGTNFGDTINLTESATPVGNTVPVSDGFHYNIDIVTGTGDDVVNSRGSYFTNIDFTYTGGNDTFTFSNFIDGY